MFASISNRFNTLLLMLLVLMAGTIIAILATRSSAGPLDPPGPVASTQSNVIYQPASCVGFPIVISTPGSYRLGGNIAGCTGKDGVQITTGNVTLDLAGFTVSGVPGSLAGIKNVGANSKLSIANGIVTSWGVAGIDMAGSSTARLDNLIAAYNTGNGFELGSTNTLSHSSATANNGNGISSSASATNVTIVDCNADYNTLRGISAFGPAAVIDGCTVGNNSGDGIRVGALAKITNNDVHNNVGVGVDADHSCMIEHNVSQWNGSYGFVVEVPGNCSVIGNKATANFYGFVIQDLGGMSRVDGNHASGNGDKGFYIGSANPGYPNIVTRNSASANVALNFVIGPFNDAAPIVAAAVVTNPMSNISN